MKKSFWVIFAFVLFVLVLIIVIGIFLLSNKPEAPTENQPNIAELNITYQMPVDYHIIGKAL